MRKYQIQFESFGHRNNVKLIVHLHNADSQDHQRERRKPLHNEKIIKFACSRAINEAVTPCQLFLSGFASHNFKVKIVKH